MKTGKRTAALVAPVAAAAVAVFGSIGPAAAAEERFLVREDEFTFNSGFDGGGEDFTCGFESRNNLWSTGFATAWTYSQEGYDPRCKDTTNYLEVSYLNTSGDPVRFTISGERNAAVHIHDVGSDLRTTHYAYYLEYSPRWTLPK